MEQWGCGQPGEPGSQEPMAGVPEAWPSPASPHLDVVLLFVVLVVSHGEAEGVSGALNQHQ